MQSNEIFKVPLSCPGLSGYILDDSLLIYSKDTQSVYGFEQESAALFLTIDELVPAHDDAAIAEQLGMHHSAIAPMCALARCAMTQESIEYEADIDTGTFTPDDKQRTHYRVADLLFSVHYPNAALRDALHANLAHLHTEETDDDSLKRIAVDFAPAETAWHLQWNGKVIAAAVPEPQLPTYVSEKMMITAYQSEPYLIALHAGAVEKAGRVIILPAASESGKTTLSASLVKEGYRLYSDEVALFYPDGKIKPLPFCMNIKEGSWEVIKKRYRDFDTLGTFKRFDNQNIRFLPPENMQQTPKKASCFIFPRYRADAPTTLTPISPNQILSRIKTAGYQVQYSMDESKFQKILRHLVALPGYTLEYSDLDDAIATIDTLVDTACQA